MHALTILAIVAGSVNSINSAAERLNSLPFRRLILRGLMLFQRCFDRLHEGAIVLQLVQVASERPLEGVENAVSGGRDRRFRSSRLGLRNRSMNVRNC